MLIGCRLRYHVVESRATLSPTGVGETWLAGNIAW